MKILCESGVAESRQEGKWTHYKLSTSGSQYVTELLIELTQYSKLISDIPPVDIVITMGCNVQCPLLPCKYREDWGLDDPSGESDEVFKISFFILALYLCKKEAIMNLSNTITKDRKDEYYELKRNANRKKHEFCSYGGISST